MRRAFSKAQRWERRLPVLYPWSPTATIAPMYGGSVGIAYPAPYAHCGQLPHICTRG